MRERSTGYVILGILALGGDLSGYEIRQWVEAAVGHFWSESFGQIYPELKRLAAEGLIAPLDDPGRKGRRVRRYRVTREGREALRRWLRRQPRPERPRDELLLKLFFGSETGARSARQFLEAAAEAQATRLALTDAAEKTVIAEDRQSPGLVWSLMTVLAGQIIHSARLEWARAALAMLDAQAEGGNEAVLKVYAGAKPRRGKRSKAGQVP